MGFPIETIVVFITIASLAFFIDMYAHKNEKEISLKNAVVWSCFWIFVSLCFACFLWVHHGSEFASLFITGYSLEKVLSVDNLFVMMAIFQWFHVDEKYRHRILYWGIIGAIVFRLIFVLIGSSLLSASHYVELLFAIIVLYSAYKLFIETFKHNETENQKNEIDDYSEHFAYKLVHKIFPVSQHMHGHHFFVSTKDLEQEHINVTDELDKETKSHLNKNKSIKWIATPLFLCLAVIEISDVMFAFDSVPAVIAVSKEPIIVYSAMMFAILGLRTMYFVLEALKKYLIHLEKAVIFLLFFIGFKLALSASNHFLHHRWEISANLSLIIVIVTLFIGIIASFIFPEKEK